jgi:hypothetical protein
MAHQENPIDRQPIEKPLERRRVVGRQRPFVRQRFGFAIARCIPGDDAPVKRQMADQGREGRGPGTDSMEQHDNRTALGRPLQIFDAAGNLPPKCHGRLS